MRRHGFTLIELLVVVTIIALLIAILLPSLKQARITARLAVCAANQRQIAVGAISYGLNNRGIMMITRKTPNAATGRNPEYINTIQTDDTGEWSVHRIQPYLSGFDIPNKVPRGVLICPSVDRDFYRELAATHWVTHLTDGYHFTQLSYAYFAGVDRWSPAEYHNGAERQLCDSRGGGSAQLLTSDVLMPNTSTGLFRYNHGREGWAWSYHPNNTAGGLEEYAPPSITGLNQSFGDGSVRWKDAGQIKTQKMFNVATYPDGWVDRAIGSPMYY
ncbi:MAG: prepilin-type N-terminal cleavage/methylation domain-containing protein [Planctomycetes bacterium]|nr:prepilin-type N-terminal cleavage/methylation domain-containing protein [Planctomycetota bacterium]